MGKGGADRLPYSRFKGGYKHVTNHIIIALFVTVFVALGIVGRCIKSKRKGDEDREQKSDTEDQN